MTHQRKSGLDPVANFANYCFNDGMSGDDSPLLRVAERMASLKATVVMSGAGISVESGIPDFRSAGGLWERFDPMEYATIEAFQNNPVKVWRMLREMDLILQRAQPNPAHKAVAELERLGVVSGVVTQNVDNLHQRAGSKNVVELHGNAERLVCLSGDFSSSAAELRERTRADDPPRCPNCGAVLKPDVILFGEPIPTRASTLAMGMVQNCETMLVVGTSALVAPASYLPVVARKMGVEVVEINREKTVLTGQVATTSLRGRAGDILPRLLEAVKLLLGGEPS